jgi:hypothetical protein
MAAIAIGHLIMRSLAGHSAIQIEELLLLLLLQVGTAFAQ